MFTRRHYEAIAEVLQQHSAEQGKRLGLGFQGSFPSIEQHLATMFKADNSRFNPERFYRACEPVE
jgi:hypothetical protein